MSFAASSGAAAEAPLLYEIRFAGNQVTREAVMRQEIGLREGQPFSPEQVEKARQAVMNLGLFKSVQAEVLEEEGRHVLLLTVEERFYILPLPLLDYRPDFLADESATNYSYGGELRFDNLFGLNQRLKIRYKEKKYIDDVEPPVKELDVTYAYPRIIGTPYSLAVDVGREEKGINLYEDELLSATTLQDKRTGRIFVSRWLNATAASEGWRAGAGVSAATYHYKDSFGISGYSDNQVVTLLGQLGYYRVDRFPYHRDGHEFSYAVQLAQPAWSSDLEYFRNTFAYRRFLPLPGVDANLNTQLKLGLGFGDGDAYHLGSSTSLRGYDGHTVDGNLLLQGNIEYHHHLSGYRQLRGVVFVDAGNVWPEVSDIDSQRLYTSAGVGARWLVQSFVDLTLRLDYAYNMDSGETKTYLDTSGSF
jgi:outer membrane protein assembly factor BamA